MVSGEEDPTEPDLDLHSRGSWIRNPSLALRGHSVQWGHFGRSRHRIGPNVWSLQSRAIQRCDGDLDIRVGDHRVSPRSSPAHGLATLRLRPSFFRTRGRCRVFPVRAARNSGASAADYVGRRKPAAHFAAGRNGSGSDAVAFRALLLQARMRQKALFLTGATARTCWALSVLLLVASGNASVPNVLGARLLSTVVEALLVARSAKAPVFSWIRTGTSFGEYRRMLRLSAPLAGAGIAGEAYGRLDQPLLAAFRGQREVGLYSAAARVADVIGLLSPVVQSVIAPGLMDLHRKRESAAFYGRGPRRLGYHSRPARFRGCGRRRPSGAHRNHRPRQLVP